MYRNIIIFIILCNSVFGQMDSMKFTEINRFKIPEAKQGVAVDDTFFYVVDDRQIAKYEKETGKFVNKWADKEDGQIIHLDSGAIIDGSELNPTFTVNRVKLTF